MHGSDSSHLLSFAKLSVLWVKLWPIYNLAEGVKLCEQKSIIGHNPQSTGIKLRLLLFLVYHCCYLSHYLVLCALRGSAIYMFITRESTIDSAHGTNETLKYGTDCWILRISSCARTHSSRWDGVCKVHLSINGAFMTPCAMSTLPPYIVSSCCISVSCLWWGAHLVK